MSRGKDKEPPELKLVKTPKVPKPKAKRETKKKEKNELVPVKEPKAETRGRPTIITEELKQQFMQQLIVNAGSVFKTCREMKIAYNTGAKIIREVPEFQKKYDELRGEWEPLLFEAAFERALEKSDLLMIFLLKAVNPSKFDENVRKSEFIKQLADEVMKRLPEQRVRIIEPSEDVPAIEHKGNDGSSGSDNT